ncbi:MAG: hypothetical protein R3B99_03710 [Polyangiales bacterium]
MIFFDHEGHLVADVDVPGTPLPYLAATEGGELVALTTDGTLLRLGPRGGSHADAYGRHAFARQRARVGW